jgi:RNA polymerase sigma-70 factor (sigma-E family)
VAEEGAVEALYRERRTDMVRAAVLLLDDQGAAEEAVQEAFVRLYRNYPGLRRPDEAAGYLYRSVVNECRSQLRRRGVARRAALVAVPDRAAPAGPSDAGALASADRAVVLAALSKLSQRQRECLVLRWYLDLSERAIAESLGISNGAVKTHLHRGLAALAQDLEVLR